jgi:uncharacterized protein
MFLVLIMLKIMIIFSLVNYLKRHLEIRLLRHSKAFKVVLVAGARQVGKSTLLRHVFSNIKQVVFDPVQDLYNARDNPDQFLETFGSPLILDEVQYAPELLPAFASPRSFLRISGEFGRTATYDAGGYQRGFAKSHA